MSRILQRIGIVSVATVLSRVLGLARDILMFATFGTSALNSAFIFAFTLPNLFRRLLGEGALTAALIPTLSEELAKNRHPGIFRLLNQVAFWLASISLVMVGLGLLVFAGIGRIEGLEERWYVGAELSRILFPYMILVCLAAMLAAALNVLQRFAVPALSAVWLNLSMIVSLGVVGVLFAATPEERMRLLCYGVLFGGLLQVAIPCWVMFREGWRPRVDPTLSSGVREIGRLMLPGVAGAAIFQVNVVVSRLLAFSLDESAVAILYLANRLMELPLGVFTLAVTTVVFPLIAGHAARGDFVGFASAYQKGVGLILAITVPAAAGIILMREPILATLFQWGAFDVSDTRSTLPVLTVFALSLPFYSLAAHQTRGFYALKDMATPVRIAGMGFLVNLALSLILMRHFGATGLALANLISVTIQTALLQLRLTRRLPGMGLDRQARDLGKVILATCGMAAMVFGAMALLEARAPEGRWSDILAVGVVIPMAVGVYALLAWLLRLEGRREMETLLRRLAGAREQRPAG